EAIADLCFEMRFLDREWLRVVLLKAKQQLIKVATVSQGSVNESLAHPRQVFKPAIVLSAYSFIMVHNQPSGAMPHAVLCRTAGLYRGTRAVACGIIFNGSAWQKSRQCPSKSKI
ncbi:MAG: hypothetical protein JO232_03450, partial [Verrucomicrobia bacterium]|nr:hypothetical protein [Verrucomicrobiota bacterium]